MALDSPLSPVPDYTHLLAQRVSEALAFDDVLERAWGDASARASLDVLVARLRKKLGDEERVLLRTVRGVGYALGEGA